jgi:hypothetical protein
MIACCNANVASQGMPSTHQSICNYLFAQVLNFTIIIQRRWRSLNQHRLALHLIYMYTPALVLYVSHISGTNIKSLIIYLLISMQIGLPSKTLISKLYQRQDIDIGSRKFSYAWLWNCSNCICVLLTYDLRKFSVRDVNISWTTLFASYLKEMCIEL